jgi:hypothetical protein
MSTLLSGDKITPNDLAVWSINRQTVIRPGSVVTVNLTSYSLLTICEERGLFPSHAFRLASFAGNHTASPQAPAVLWNKGDKVTPKKEVARSICGNITIAPKQVVTIKEVNGNFFLAKECFGIFSALDFIFVRSAESAESPSPLPQRVATRSAPPPVSFVPPRNVPIRQEPTNRKAVKKKFERQFGTLEWRDGYLCNAGTENRIPNSPYLPSDKPPKKMKQPWE